MQSYSLRVLWSLPRYEASPCELQIDVIMVTASAGGVQQVCSTFQVVRVLAPVRRRSAGLACGLMGAVSHSLACQFSVFSARRSVWLNHP